MHVLFLFGLLGNLESVLTVFFFSVINLDPSLLGIFNSMHLIFKLCFGCESMVVQKLAL